MADLFSVTAPLMIRFPDGEKRVMAECFRHPDGLLFFDLFWDPRAPDGAVHLVTGAIKGEGPWKVGECVVNVLGCGGTDPQLAAEFADWQMYLQQPLSAYPSREEIEATARRFGAELQRRAPAG